MTLIKIKKVGWLLAITGLCLSSQQAIGQFSKGWSYATEAGVSFSGGEHTPFWLVSNRQGLSSIEKNNGYIRAGVFRAMEKDKHFSYAFGIDLAGAYHFSSAFVIQQLYADIKYRCLQLSVGSKERFSEFNNPLLSSGGLTFSGNARPIPQVRISIPEYTLVPGTKGWLAFKAHLAYGLFTDDHWQRDFIQSPNQKHTEHVLYHSKALYVRIGNREKFPLQLEGGLEMAAQFGGKSITGDQVIDMPNGIKDFFKVLIPSSGDSSTPIGEQTNIYGNHLGSWNFSLTWFAPQSWVIRPYYEHFFEDHSQMFGEYGWKDGLVGVELTFPENPIISSFVYEYLGTKDQSGAVYWDHTPEIPEQISATDNYYNHGIYTGWQHWGQAIGNPLLISPIYNEDGSIQFKSTRVKAHHFGILGRPHADWQYRALFSFSRHWGTYTVPLYEVEKNANAMLEVTYKPHQWKGWEFSLAGAIDRGAMLGRSAGGMLTIKKRGIIR